MAASETSAQVPTSTTDATEYYTAGWDVGDSLSLEELEFVEYELVNELLMLYGFELHDWDPSSFQYLDDDLINEIFETFEHQT